MLKRISTVVLRLVSKGCKLVGCGSAVPSLQVSNDDLAKVVDTSDEWISVRTGIHNRRVLTTRLSCLHLDFCLPCYGGLVGLPGLNLLDVSDQIVVLSTRMLLPDGYDGGKEEANGNTARGSDDKATMAETMVEEQWLEGGDRGGEDGGENGKEEEEKEEKEEEKG
ncbi:hypothetical protein ACSBR2_015763 [Camellia fascicularis]